MKRIAIAVLALFTVSCSGDGGDDTTGPQAPTVSITSPDHGATVEGTVTIRATGRTQPLTTKFSQSRLSCEMWDSLRNFARLKSNLLRHANAQRRIRVFTIAVNW